MDELSEELAPLVLASWKAVLGHEEFGLESDFFAIGGNSFLVAQVMASLSKQIGARLPLRLFFSNPTVRGIERAIAAHQGRP
ncbi:phosphopantetheine-binding protein [Streptosporangium roseum]|uniref:phosphopantetheine-binding protein n=1 Tax=Streptosporangium roseum TaxID=2001 RepID=UPI00332941D9